MLSLLGDSFSHGFAIFFLRACTTVNVVNISKAHKLIWVPVVYQFGRL